MGRSGSFGTSGLASGLAVVFVDDEGDWRQDRNLGMYGEGRLREEIAVQRIKWTCRVEVFHLPTTCDVQSASTPVNVQEIRVRHAMLCIEQGQESSPTLSDPPP